MPKKMPKKVKAVVPGRSYHTCSGNCLCSFQGMDPHSEHCSCRKEEVTRVTK